MAISNMWENGFAQQLIPNDFVLKKKKDYFVHFISFAWVFFGFVMFLLVLLWFSLVLLVFSIVFLRFSLVLHDFYWF